MPPRVIKPSLELAAIVGKKEASRAELQKLLWTYIKNNNLQCMDPKALVNIRGFIIGQDIGPHLFPNPAKNYTYDSD